MSQVRSNESSVAGRGTKDVFLLSSPVWAGEPESGLPLGHITGSDSPSASEYPGPLYSGLGWLSLSPSSTQPASNSRLFSPFHFSSDDSTPSAPVGHVYFSKVFIRKKACITFLVIKLLKSLNTSIPFSVSFQV